MTFPSTYWSLAGERLLGAAGFRVRLRPVPRTLSSSCGSCLELLHAAAPSAAAAATRLGVIYDGIFTRTGQLVVAAPAGEGRAP